MFFGRSTHSASMLMLASWWWMLRLALNPAILKWTFCIWISTSRTQTSLLSDFVYWFEFQSLWTTHSSTMKCKWKIVYNNYSVQIIFFIFYHIFFLFYYKKSPLKSLLALFFIRFIWKNLYKHLKPVIFPALIGISR